MKKHNFMHRTMLFLLALLTAFTLICCNSGDSDSGEDKEKAKTEEEQKTGGSSSVSSVTLDRPEANILVGNEFTLTATVNAANGVAKTVSWSSSDSTVASVAEGKVTAIAAGEATITATSTADTSKKATCVVTVGSSATTGGNTVWDFSTQPSNITDATVSYTNETLEPSSGTSASLKVTASDLKWATSYLQTGKNGVDYTSYETKSKATFTLTTTVKSTITIVMSGSGSSDTSYRWIVVTDSSGNIVEKIESSTSGTEQILKIENAVAGTYTIYTNGVRINSITVEGEESGVAVVYPSGITLNKSELSLDLNSDSTSETLVATITNAAEVTSGYDKINWASSNSSVATVADGLVTAKKAGSVTITAAAKYGVAEATCTVTVTGAVAGKTISLTDAPVGYASLGTSYVTSGTQTVVTTRDELLAAVKNGGIIVIDGMIDMSDGLLAETGSGATSLTLGTSALDTFVHNTVSTYTSYEDWVDKYSAACSATTEDGEKGDSNSTLYDDLWKLNAAYGNLVKITLKSNTTIIGKDENAGIRGGSFQLNGISNIQIRNLTLQDACDPFPHHEVNSSGTSDGFNAQWDCITIQGSCSNIWIDHCTLEDTLKLGYATKGTKEKWQIFDGLCDMKNDSTKITVSNCIFKNHDKTMLIGSSDSDGDNSKRFVTLYGNYFWNCGQRLPMVRNTTIHVLNNYYDSDSEKFYDNSYGVGCRKNCIVYAENNYFGSGIKYSFKDSYGSLYSSGNTDNSKSGCNSTVTGSTLFSSLNKYTYTAVSAAEAKTNAEENAGAGYILK